VTLNKFERDHLVALQGRADYLREKIATWDRERGGKGVSYLKQELAAIEWVFTLVEEIEDEDHLVPPVPATPDGEG